MARFDLGLSTAEFWSLTLRELLLLADRRNQAGILAALPIANLTAVYANCHRDEKKRSKPFTAEDFLPGHAAPEKPQSPEEMKAVMQQWVLAMQGKL